VRVPIPPGKSALLREFALLGLTEHLLGVAEQSAKTSRRFLALLGGAEHLLGVTEQSKLRGRTLFSRAEGPSAAGVRVHR
jgi:hypothetical protein